MKNQIILKLLLLNKLAVNIPADICIHYKLHKNFISAVGINISRNKIMKKEVEEMHNIVEPFNDRNAQNSFDSSEVESNKLLVAICYVIPILFFVPILMDKNSSFCKFHANQQLTLLIAGVALGIVCKLLSFIPIVGAIVCAVVGIAVLLLIIALAYGAWSGMALRIPFIGNLIEIF